MDLVANVAGRALTWLAEASLEASALVAVALAAGFAVRRAPARVRRSLWSTTLVGILAIPALAQVLPGWDLPLLPLPRMTSPADLVETATTFDDLYLAEKAAADSSAAGLPWTVWTAAGWLAGALAVLAWWLLGQRQVRRRLRSAERSPDPDLAALVTDARRRLGISRPVDLVFSGGVSMPMTWGVLRPVVLLPPAARSWSTERLRVVLWHELVHVRRGDWLVQTLAHLACTFHWFNPLVWTGVRRLAEEREKACDDDVLGLGARPTDYATHLIDVARAMSSTVTLRALPSTLTMASPSKLEGRLRAILDREPRPGSGARWPVAAAMTAVILFLGAFHPWAEARPASLPGAPGTLPAKAIWDLVAGKRWPEAETALAALVASQPEDGMAWFYLGYVRHMQGDLDGALEADQRAIAFPMARPTALYNVACIHAVRGEKELAVGKLEEAVDAGFERWQTLREDPELASLRDDPRFLALLAGSGNG